MVFGACAAWYSRSTCTFYPLQQQLNVALPWNTNHNHNHNHNPPSRPPFFDPNLVVLLMVVAAVPALRALALEADSTVGGQVTGARVAGGGDSEANDNTWESMSNMFSST